jgi:hypothetical protein
VLYESPYHVDFAILLKTKINTIFGGLPVEKGHFASTLPHKNAENVVLYGPKLFISGGTRLRRL